MTAPRQCVLRVTGVYDWFQTGSPVVDLDLDPVDGQHPRAVLGWIEKDFNWTERPRVRVHYEQRDIYPPGDAHPNHYGLDLDSSTGMLHLREWFQRRFGDDCMYHLILDVTRSSVASSLCWVLRANAMRMLRGQAPYAHVVGPWYEGWDGMERNGPDSSVSTVHADGWYTRSARGTTWSGPETGAAGMLAADKAAHAHGVWCVGYSEEQEP